MIRFSSLNKAQKEAVTAPEDHIRVIAGAGSGKTRVLTMRIVYLIDKLNVDPSRILAITFTNKAAAEMKTRINEMLGNDNNTVWVSTIHSLCVRILREDIGYFDYPKNFTIVDQSDQNAILKEAYKEYGVDKKDIGYGRVLDYIGNMKTEGIDPKRAAELTNGVYMNEIKAKIYGYYVERLKSMYALDFDDLILWTVDLFDKHKEVQKKWSRHFEYVHVDEFQDIDHVQYRLIRQLSAYHDHLYVVGDPDQTIYTWRGADVNIIIDFEKDYKDCRTITLSENYRSTNNILSGANSVIRNNKMRLKKDLFTSRDGGPKITHNTLINEEYEAYYVRQEIERQYQNGTPYHDIAILYRSNYLSRALEKVLMEARIPYRVFGGIRFYERSEVKDTLSYLRMITTADDLAFSRIINAPRRGIGQKTLDSILEIAKREDMTMYEVVKAGLYPKMKSTLDSFVKMVESWRDSLDKVTLEQLLQRVLDESGYRRHLEDEKETERLENIKSLLDDISEYQEIYPESTLEEYLQMISLYTDKNVDTDVDNVNLMTIHSAKGLEFEVVFVIGMSEGVFPSELSLADGMRGLEEERRLAYVAFTRAKRKLYLTDNSSFSFVTKGTKNCSRFVLEIPDEYMEDIVEKKKSEHRNTVSIFDEEDVASIKTGAVKKNDSAKLKAGDKVSHQVFGKGVVVSLTNNIATIAFSHPHGIKKILATHPSIEKI